MSLVSIRNNLGSQNDRGVRNALHLWKSGEKLVENPMESQENFWRGKKVIHCQCNYIFYDSKSNNNKMLTKQIQLNAITNNYFITLF